MTTQHLWLWLGPYVLLMLCMVFAMLEFTVSLLAKRPAHRRKPLDAAALRAKLAATAASRADTLRVGQACDFEFIWADSDTIDAPRLRARRSSTVRLRLLLDAERHEVRAGETAQSSGYLVGLVGWLPRLRAYAGYSANPPGASPLLDDLRTTVLAAGWTYRPVVLPFLATYGGTALVRRFTPVPLRRTSPGLLWGILYPLSYWLGIGWFLALGGPALWTARTLWLLALVSGAWWGVWGLLAWAICGFPRFWRRRRAPGQA